jgi:hypothetical protein
MGVAAIAHNSSANGSIRRSSVEFTRRHFADKPAAVKFNLRGLTPARFTAMVSPLAAKRKIVGDRQLVR